MGPPELPVADELPPRYAATVGGALAGGVPGGAIGVALSLAYMNQLGDSTDGAFVVLALVFLLMGSGVAVGVWVALRAARDRVAGRTAVMAGLGFLAWTVVSLPSLFWVTETARGGGTVKLLVQLGVAAMLAGPPALGARWIILANERLAKREERSR